MCLVDLNTLYPSQQSAHCKTNFSLAILLLKMTNFQDGPSKENEKLSSLYILILCVQIYVLFLPHCQEDLTDYV